MTEENKIVQENKEDFPITANKEKMEESATNEVSIMRPFNEIDRIIDQFLDAACLH